MLGMLFSGFSRTRFWVWLVRVVFSNLNLRLWGDGYGAVKKLETIREAIMSIDHDTEICCFVCHNNNRLGGRLIRLVTGEYWTHCGFVISGNSVAHVQPQGGMRFCSLAEVVASYDDFAVVAFDLRDGDNSIKILRERMNKFAKAKYDFQKVLDGDRYNLYCSEFIYFLLQGIIKQNFEPRLLYGQLGFTPQDLYNSSDKVLFTHTRRDWENENKMSRPKAAG